MKKNSASEFNDIFKFIQAICIKCDECADLGLLRKTGNYCKMNMYYFNYICSRKNMYILKEGSKTYIKNTDIELIVDETLPRIRMIVGIKNTDLKIAFNVIKHLSYELNDIEKYHDNKSIEVENYKVNIITDKANQFILEIPEKEMQYDGYSETIKREYYQLSLNENDDNYFKKVLPRYTSYKLYELYSIIETEAEFV